VVQLPEVNAGLQALQEALLVELGNIGLDFTFNNRATSFNPDYVWVERFLKLKTQDTASDFRMNASLRTVVLPDGRVELRLVLFAREGFLGQSEVLKDLLLWKLEPTDDWRQAPNPVKALQHYLREVDFQRVDWERCAYAAANVADQHLQH
jgi:hypothetical protein